MEGEAALGIGKGGVRVVVVKEEGKHGMTTEQTSIMKRSTTFLVLLVDEVEGGRKGGRGGGRACRTNPTYIDPVTGTSLPPSLHPSLLLRLLLLLLLLLVPLVVLTLPHHPSRTPARSPAARACFVFVLPKDYGCYPSRRLLLLLLLLLRLRLVLLLLLLVVVVALLLRRVADVVLRTFLPPLPHPLPPH